MGEYIENPKLVGSNIVACFPQGKPCPIGCNQCYATDGMVYVPMTQPNIPDPAWAGERIVRMNDLGDSNVERDKVINCGVRYKHTFFNTSIPRLDFPGPVILTVNPKEEDPETWTLPADHLAVNLMAVRVRVSVTNADSAAALIRAWTREKVYVLLMHMRYYDAAPGEGYECHKHIVNDCWQPTWTTRRHVEHICGVGHDHLLYVCEGSCRDCHQCESLFWLCKRRTELGA